MPTTALIHQGARGPQPSPAKDGAGVSDVRASLIESPVVSLFRPNKLAQDVSWSRNDEAAITDRYGNQIFVAGDEIRHRLSYSNDFDDTVGWADASGVWVRDSTNESDPLGGTSASQITLSNTTGITSVMLGNCSAFGGQVYRISLYAKVISGTVTSVEARLGGLADNNFILASGLTSSWQRIDVLATPSQITSSISLNFVTTGAVIHLYQVNMTAGHLLYAPYTTGASATEDLVNPDPVQRSNDLGYCIEGEKENLCPFSQNLTSWQTTGNPTIENNINPDAYGDANTPTRIVFVASQSITLEQTVALTVGQSYSVSFYAVADQGSVESLSVQLGGGVSTSVAVTNSYVRQSVQVVAGSSGTISFSATSGASGSAFFLTGVQVELGELSSYIPTGTAAQVREADLVAYPGNKMPSFMSPFTARIAWNEISSVGSNKTLLETGITLEFNDTVLSFDGVAVADAVEAQEAIIVFDGAALTIYLDAIEIYSAAYTASSSGAVTAYIGSSNSSGDNALNGYIRACDWWDFAMTQNEIEFISEVDHGNRNS